jgi:hypothetical protein
VAFVFGLLIATTLALVVVRVALWVMEESEK